jgi:hypothetical protein
MFFLSFVLFFIISSVAASTNPKDALINPRGQKVCMQQCGTSELRCPEAFWKEQVDMCYRCCATWGETVIKIECNQNKVGKNGTRVEGKSRKEEGAVKGKENVPGRELGFS